MEIPVDQRKELINRAWHLMKTYRYDALTAICIAEQNLEAQNKKENEEC